MLCIYGTLCEPESLFFYSHRSGDRSFAVESTQSKLLQIFIFFGYFILGIRIQCLIKWSNKSKGGHAHQLKTD